MKPVRSLLVASTAVILASALLGGCYTQLALNSDESEAVADTQSTEISQPLPTAIIVEPVYIPVAPPLSPLPVARSSDHGASVQPASQPSQRDIGNQRTGSSSGQENSGSTVRTSGSTHGGR